jgi:hypothetical protein
MPQLVRVHRKDEAGAAPRNKLCYSFHSDRARLGALPVHRLHA